MSNETLFVKALSFGCFNFESAVWSSQGLFSNHHDWKRIQFEKESDDWHVCNFTTLPKSGKTQFGIQFSQFSGKVRMILFRQEICINFHWEKDKNKILIWAENTCLLVLRLSVIRHIVTNPLCSLSVTQRGTKNNKRKFPNGILLDFYLVDISQCSG